MKHVNNTGEIRGNALGIPLAELQRPGGRKARVQAEGRRNNLREGILACDH